LDEFKRKGVVKEVHVKEENVGQHVCWNEAAELAFEAGYRHFLRVDDDCEFLTKRWLKKLLESSSRLDDKMILAPVVKGLKRPPRKSNVCQVNGVPLEFLAEAIGGVCRLHPLKVLMDGEGKFVADVRKPLGSGDATGIAAWCRQHVVPMAYTRHIRVRHNTTKQETVDPAHFEFHSVFQCVPYIPAWSPHEDCNT
jgi:hypothetical protein